ncbi:hypothetical protein [Sulfitobacter sp. PS-8MA]|uniref:hypothetical protein n=1 Tax=Sulfitobacter sp. PS-8MA TaxID=3237707 RepID=UPI0034C63E0A
MTRKDPDDPKRLIYESYRIDGIGPAECRSIFLDWALSLALEHDSTQALSRLLTRYEAVAPDHPMTQVLRDGQTTLTAPRRRGGWRSRPRN